MAAGGACQTPPPAVLRLLCRPPFSPCETPCRLSLSAPPRESTGALTLRGVGLARRYLYKVYGPQACNFPVSAQLAEELDKVTVEELREQYLQEIKKCALFSLF